MGSLLVFLTYSRLWKRWSQNLLSNKQQKDDTQPLLGQKKKLLIRQKKKFLTTRMVTHSNRHPEKLKSLLRDFQNTIRQGPDVSKELEQASVILLQNTFLYDLSPHLQFYFILSYLCSLKCWLQSETPVHGKRWYLAITFHFDQKQNVLYLFLIVLRLQKVKH